MGLPTATWCRLHGAAYVNLRFVVGVSGSDQCWAVCLKPQTP